MKGEERGGEGRGRGGAGEGCHMGTHSDPCLQTETHEWGL